MALTSRIAHGRAVWLTAAGAALQLMLGIGAAGPAHAQPEAAGEARLLYEVAPECPSEEAFRDLVLARLGRTPFRVEGARAVQVRIERLGRSFRTTVSLPTERAFETSDCEDAVATAAVIVALELDTPEVADSSGSTDGTPPSWRQELSPGAREALEALERERPTPPADPEPVEAPPSDDWSVSLGVDPDELLWDLRVTPVPGGSLLASWRAQVSGLLLDAETIGWNVEVPRWAMFTDVGELPVLMRRESADDRLPADAIAFDPGDGSTLTPRGLAFSIERATDRRGAYGRVQYTLHRGFVGPDLRSLAPFEVTPIRTRGQVQPAAAARGDQVLAVWREGSRVLARLMGIDEVGPVVVLRPSREGDGLFIGSAGLEFHGEPAAVATDSGFLVAWREGSDALEWVRLDRSARVVRGLSAREN